MRRRFGEFVSAQNTFLALALLIPFSSKLKWFPNNARANQNRFFSLLRACLHPSLGAFFFVVVVVRMRKKKFKKCENQGHLGLAQGPSKAHVQAFDEAWALFFCFLSADLADTPAYSVLYSKHRKMEFPSRTWTYPTKR